jgi:hypothetical protein
MITLLWSSVFNNGGSIILGYKIVVNDSSTSEIVSVDAQATSYLHNGLTGGKTYNFTISAFNKYGIG